MHGAPFEGGVGCIVDHTGNTTYDKGDSCRFEERSFQQQVVSRTVTNAFVAKHEEDWNEAEQDRGYTVSEVIYSSEER